MSLTLEAGASIYLKKIMLSLVLSYSLRNERVYMTYSCTQSANYSCINVHHVLQKLCNAMKSKMLTKDE